LTRLVAKSTFQIVSYGVSVYFGEMKNEKRHGQGVLVSDKSIFEGTFENDLRVAGSEKNLDGVYTGTYANDLRNGQGKY
jgi:hypothetical protein